MEIPKEPKRYTTVYGNFKGVDFTNDPTNVYRLRSPDGLNMTPDLDGSPRKRHGWKIHFGAESFKNVYNIVTGNTWTEDVYTKKLFYFELGGIDYIVIFNNIGVFSWDGTLLRFHYYVYDEGDVVSKGTFDSSKLDENRSFFFEGKGTAGFYMFSGLDLYRIGSYEYHAADDPYTQGEEDGATIPRIFRTTPYYPITHIACNYNHSSATTYEPINMLTPIRRVQFMGDGSNSIFYTPTNADSVEKVEWLNDKGVWTNIPKTTGTKYYTDHTNSGGDIDGVQLNWTPAASTEDIIRVTYTGINSASTVTEKTMIRSWQTTKLSAKATQTMTTATCTKYSSGQTRTFDSDWKSGAYGTASSIKLVFDSSGIKTVAGVPALTVQYNNGGTATNLTNYRTVSYGAYNKTTNVTVGDSLYKNITVGTPSVTYSSKKTTGSGTIYVGQYTSALQKQTLRVKLTSLGFSDAQVDTMMAYDLIRYTKYERTATKTKSYSIRIKYQYDEITNTSLGNTEESRMAFEGSTRVSIYGNGIINQVFIGATKAKKHTNRVWYSGPTDPTYFPDTNYMEVGSNDTHIMGMIKVGEYLGIVKQGSTLDSSVYLAYPTTFDEDTAYAVKQKVAGVGAVSNGAFNVLNDEPLFLSKEGVMAIIPSETSEKQLKNRSYYINKKLLEENSGESDLSSAISFIFNNMYLLAINNHVYVLDGAQKSSWANERTNLQYECYYWENVPAQCFARLDDQLWFSDFQGNLCRFKTDDDDYPWFDGYSQNVLGYAATGVQWDSYYIEHFKLDAETLHANIDYVGYLSIRMITWDSFTILDSTDTVLAQDLSKEELATYGITFDRLDSGQDVFLASATIVEEYVIHEPTPEYTVEITLDTHNVATFDDDYISKWTNNEDGTYEFVGGIPTGGNVTSVYEDVDNEYNSDWLWLGSGTKVTPTTDGTWEIKGTYDPSTGTKEIDAGDHVNSIFKWNGEEYYAAQPIWLLGGKEVSLSDYGILVPEREWKVLTYWLSVEKETITIDGAPILARWSTIADDDGMPHYFKNLQKKGTMVILTPASDSGVKVYIKPDNKDPIYVGETDAFGKLPIDYYTKKKVKKYKRLQFICENDGLLDSFGIDQIIKSYTVGNYSKNR